ncbi:kinase-like protein [Thermothelomyces heterothallicus CBS 203.75]
MMALSLKYVDNIRHFLVSAARWAWGSPDPLVIEFLPRTYGENAVQPRKRWLKLILRSSRSQWHLKVSFHGTIQDDQHPIFGKKLKRRNDLQDLCRCIDFRRIQLLDNTVTEVILSLDPGTQSVRLPCQTQPAADSEYISVISHLWVRTLEDPLRIRFPVFDNDSGIPTKELSEIREKEELNGHSVYKVLLYGDETVYVYKEVERPHYVPPDTEVLQQELQNLELFRGNTVGIVQLVAAVISQNPYQTAQTGKENDSNALRGILLEYHPNGTLEDTLKSPKPETNGRWCQWALQIASALAEMHQRGLAHMDLKPANIVISADFDAVLIDISGIGGVTRQWLSPEMLDKGDDPLSWSIEARKQNDIWALGRIMLAMADACCTDDEEQLLRSVGQAAARPLPRIPLSDAITALSNALL